MDDADGADTKFSMTLVKRPLKLTTYIALTINFGFFSNLLNTLMTLLIRVSVKKPGNSVLTCDMSASGCRPPYRTGIPTMTIIYRTKSTLHGKGNA